jgi:hypothetical protein
MKTQKGSASILQPIYIGQIQIDKILHKEQRALTTGHLNTKIGFHFGTNILLTYSRQLEAQRKINHNISVDKER